MYTLYTLPALLLLIPSNTESALKCKYGQQTLCGSDGFTYFNMCDFEIVQSVRPHLTVKHLGACRARKGLLLNALTKILHLQESNLLNGLNALRRQKKDSACRERNEEFRELTKVILSQMTNRQTNIDAFNFNNNAVNTQGEGNLFQIDIAKN